MRTKRKKEEPEVFTVGPSDGREENPASENSKKERFQLSFDLNEDGSPDFSAMRERTKEKVREFFSDPKMASAFGTKAAQPDIQIFHPAMVAAMYAVLGSVEAMAITRLTKIPEPVAKQVFTYSKEEIDALSGPTIRVLNKYAADWMIKYQDEIALAGLLVSITVAKVNAALLLAKIQSGNIQPNGSQAKSEENGKKERDEPVVPN